EGCRVKSFAFGEECINALHENPDLIILDFFFVRKNQKPMNGLETFDRLRKINPELPVIILSAQERGEVMIDLARKGITDYVIKDNNLFDNLIVSVREILEK
ncbi:MAG: response regulator, partial [Bacteroidales bacterium]|nr:response regulator [Bacteroidales bacterium]